MNYVELHKKLKGGEAEKSHAIFSPSSAKRWIACAASLDLKGELMPQVESDVSAEGSIAHLVSEKDLLGETIPSKLYKLIPLHIINDAADFTQYVRKDFKDGEYETLKVETKVKLKFIHPELSGTIDVGNIKHYDTLHAIDLKYGRKYVSHVDNEQILIYLIGLAQEHNFDFAHYKGTVYQPRGGGKTERTAEYTNTDLRKFIDVLKRAVEAAYKPNPTPVEGAYCFFCPKKLAKLKDGTIKPCPAISKKALESARLDFDDEIQPSAKELSRDQLATILAKAQYLKMWVAEIEAYAHAELAKGKKIDGFSLVPTRPTTKWVDVKKVEKFISANKLEDVFYTREILSPANARKLLSKRLSDKRLEKFLSLYTVAVSSGYKLNTQTDTSLDFSLDDES